jgi:long-chain acyl-CoA synthetase
MLSHRNLVANARNMALGAAYGAADSFLHTAPMFHLADGSSIYPLTWRGTRHVIQTEFDPGRVIETIERERVTCTIMVPTMIHAVVSHPRAASADFSSLRLVLHGGAPPCVSTRSARAGFALRSTMHTSTIRRRQ